MTASDDGQAGERPSDDRQVGLAERVRAVEEQPLEDRAVAFAALHDELRTRLEHGGGAGA